MKKKLLLAAVVTVCLFSGCSGKDAEVARDGEEQPIVETENEPEENISEPEETVDEPQIVEEVDLSGEFREMTDSCEFHLIYRDVEPYNSNVNLKVMDEDGWWEGYNGENMERWTGIVYLSPEIGDNYGSLSIVDGNGEVVYYNLAGNVFEDSDNDCKYMVYQIAFPYSEDSDTYSLRLTGGGDYSEEYIDVSPGEMEITDYELPEVVAERIVKINDVDFVLMSLTGWVSDALTSEGAYTEYWYVFLPLTGRKDAFSADGFTAEYEDEKYLEYYTLSIEGMVSDKDQMEQASVRSSCNILNACLSLHVNRAENESRPNDITSNESTDAHLYYNDVLVNGFFYK